jgi:hypothetical protein
MPDDASSASTAASNAKPLWPSGGVVSELVGVEASTELEPGMKELPSVVGPGVEEVFAEPCPVLLCCGVTVSADALLPFACGEASRSETSSVEERFSQDNTTTTAQIHRYWLAPAPCRKTFVLARNRIQRFSRTAAPLAMKIRRPEVSGRECNNQLLGGDALRQEVETGSPAVEVPFFDPELTEAQTGRHHPPSQRAGCTFSARLFEFVPSVYAVGYASLQAYFGRAMSNR